ncbi:S1 domain-containing post-transcriptional regulator GSP13 [Clostridiaceae bacterium 35-E11]
MSNNFQVGNIVAGKVTAIKPFGAFVALDETHQGLVHISQVAHSFVKDINEHLSVGDEVQVKIIAIDEATGKISLSIRETQPAPEPQKERPQRSNPKKSSTNYRDPKNNQSFNSFEDKLKDWLKQSNEHQEALNKRNKR